LRFGCTLFFMLSTSYNVISGSLILEDLVRLK
jgi:hypothetical protein